MAGKKNEKLIKFEVTTNNKCTAVKKINLKEVIV